MLQESLNEAFFEFAFTVKEAMRRGWDLVEIKYGERRMGVGPCLIIRRGEETKNIYDGSELEDMLRREGEAEEMKKWQK